MSLSYSASAKYTLSLTTRLWGNTLFDGSSKRTTSRGVPPAAGTEYNPEAPVESMALK
jgi:hypothetical protein